MTHRFSSPGLLRQTLEETTWLLALLLILVHIVTLLKHSRDSVEMTL